MGNLLKKAANRASKTRNRPQPTTPPPKREKAPSLDEFGGTYTRIPKPPSNEVDRRISEKDLSSDQLSALTDVTEAAYYKNFSTFGGHAGTGKSTLIPFISRNLGDTESTAFASFTGKAANVMERKLHAAGVYEMPYVGTIHRLIYQPITDENGQILRWFRKESPLKVDETHISRIILDEASMIGAKLIEDLQTYGIPILAVGDHGQLQPINDDSVMKEPDICLTQIHRQAAQNPIIQLANIIRQEGDFPKNFPNSQEIQFCDDIDQMLHEIGDSYERLKENMAILVRTNLERKRFNLEPRAVKEPVPGDIVICLKNSPPIYNGMRGILKKVEPYKSHWYRATVVFSDDGLEVTGLLNKHQFGHDKTLETPFDLQKLDISYPRQLPLGLLFDYGVCMTVHKSQGSAFEDVFLFPNRWARDTDEEYGKWLYTAVTRASKRLFISR